MSGHSKWSQIKRQKGVADARRGQIFTKLANAITIAAKEGGNDDPATNFRLRLAIEQAKTANMPKENIQRAIERGTGPSAGSGLAQLEQVVYEGFGPAGIALLIEAATSNRNRTTAEIKSIIERSGGNLAAPGSVAWTFNKKGLITLAYDSKNIDEIILLAADAGAEDVEEAGDFIEVYTKAEDIEKIKESLISKNQKIENSEITMKPTNITKVNDPNIAKKVLTLMDKLDSVADVQKVYANFDIPDNILEGIQES